MKLLTSFSLLVAMLCSCSSQDEPNFGSIANPTGDVTEWTLEMSMPDMPKTRAAGQNAQGTDGLYSFSREINKLWYAVYYNDEWVYDCTTPEAQQPVRIGDNFSLVFRLPQLYDPTKVKLFFWAGNADDKVTTDNVTSVSDGINLNFKERCVSLSPKYLNGDGEIAQYDSFCGYFQLTSSEEIANFNQKFTLKRPFAQIHILNDEICKPEVSSMFENGLSVMPGLGSNPANETNISSNLVLPTTWFYDNSKTLMPAYKQGEYIYSQTNYEYINLLSNKWPYKTVFNRREFNYLTCFLIFAPSDINSKFVNNSSGSSVTYQILNLSYKDKNLDLSEASFVSIKLPANGIMANNRYVFYNKSGESPFFSDTYEFVITADNSWGSIQENTPN